MSASISDIASGARTFLRDFPMYFEVDQGLLNTLTIRLPHPLISPETVTVYTTTPPVPPATAPTTAVTKAWQLDDRNGLLKITDEGLLNKAVLVSGYHFSWFLDSDLSFHASQVLAEFSYSGNVTLNTMAPAQLEVTMLGTVVRALWSLSMELMLDIDVNTPEGMMIPARQRYMQVLQMLGPFEAEFQTKADLLGLGLGALEVFRLRRVSYTTGRYVPVYRDREFDDPRWPDRLYPPIPWGVPPSQDVTPAYAKYREITGTLPTFTHGDTSPYTVEEIGHGSYDDLGQGWTSLGTRGDWP
jgi:hypothetical protein